MRALFDDAAMVEHDDAIGLLHGRQPVCYHDRRAAGHCGFQRSLHHSLALCIQRAGRFVQQQQRRIFQYGARDGDALPLTARQPHAALAKEGFVAFRQGSQKVMREGGTRSSMNFVGGGIGPAVANVLEGAGRKDHRVLRHQADAVA